MQTTFEKIIYLSVSNGELKHKGYGDCSHLAHMRTSFKLKQGVSGWNDVVFDSFTSAVKSVAEDIEILGDNIAIVPINDHSLLEFKLKKWGFKVEQDTKKEEIFEEVKKKVEPIAMGTQRKLIPKRDIQKPPEITAIELKLYIKEGKIFRLLDRIIEHNKNLTIESVLKKTLNGLNIKSTDKAIAIPNKVFFSIMEKENKILSYFSERLKDENRIDYIKKVRDEDLVKIYEIALQNIQDIGIVIEIDFNKWIFVDGNRLYDLIGKFGTQNKKAYYIWRGYYILKMFRGDHVLIVRRDILENSLDKEYIKFHLLHL